MNHVFAALAVAAFGMVVLGGDASAAPAATQAKPAHKQSAPKAAAVKAPSKKAAPKAAAVRAPAAKAAPAKAQADKRPAEKSRVEKGANAKGRTSKDRAEKEVVSKKADAQAGRPVRLSKAEARAAAREERLAARGKKNRVAREEPPAREPRGREVAARAEREQPVRGTRRQAAEVAGRVPAPTVPAARQAQLPLPAPMPAPGPATRGIGREAFVPTTPPVPRGEAVRQLRSPQPIPAQAPVGRQTVVIPPPPAPSAAPVAQLRPTVEAPKPVARPAVPVYAPSSSLSAAEAAAAAAAAMSAARVAESAPVPAPAPAPASIPQAPTPAPAVSAPAQPPAAVIQRPARGAARAYAMDGATFYQGGRKIRVQGLDVREPGMTSEHATQRLQRALDGGSLSVEPVETDGSGHLIAVVRVNGRNVADTVRAAAN